MKIFTFKNGVFGVHTPYPLPKIWRLHLATLKVPTPNKMDSKHDEEMVEMLHDEVLGPSKDIEGDMPSVADAIAYDDYEDEDHPISDAASERELEGERTFYEKRRAADRAAYVPEAVEMAHAKTELMHGVLAEQDAEGFDSVDAEVLFEQLKEVDPAAAKKIAADKELVAEIRHAAAREAADEAEDQELSKQQAELHAKLREGCVAAPLPLFLVVCRVSSSCFWEDFGLTQRQ